LERIITPSITACPPNASDGSSFPLAVSFIPKGNFIGLIFFCEEV
jgi:hypothetical protein